MLFPIFYGHLTFASHRCWTIYIKKGIYLAAEAWRRKYGHGLQHEGKQEEGGVVVQFVRPTAEHSTVSECHHEDVDGGAASGLRQEVCEDGVTTKQMKHAYGATRACPDLKKGCGCSAEIHTGCTKRDM